MNEAQLQKMQEYNQKEVQAIAEMHKLPMSSEERQRYLDEHFEAHGQINPNKRKQ